MGLFGFGKKKSGGGKVARLEKKVENKWGQSAERIRAMQMLADLNTEDAWGALLKRFTFRIEGGIHDEDEKRAAYEMLLGGGEACIAAIEHHVATRDGVYWPLRALRESMGEDRAVELLLQALDRAETVSTRVNEHKVQLVANMRDFPHPKVLARLKLLAADPSDDVRIMAIDGLMTYGEDEAVAVVAARLCAEDESPRTRAVVFEQLVDLGWSLEAWREQLEERELVPVHYRLSPKGRVVRAQ